MNERRVHLELLVLCVLLAGPTAPAAAGTEPDPAPARVRALEFEGVEALPVAQLREVMLTTAPDRLRFWRPAPYFDEEDLQDDLHRIVNLYRENGYYETRAAYRLDWNDARTRVRVTVEVEEGEPVRLASWTLETPPELDPGLDGELQRALPEVDSVFGAVRYRAARSRVLDAVADRGFPEASLEGGADIDLATHRAVVAWKLETGRRVTIGRIHVTGLVDVEEKVVLRELQLEEGDRYSLKALRKSEKRVFDVGLFKSVAIQAQPAEAGAPDVWPLEIRVVERPFNSVRVGVGYGTEDDFRVSTAWSHRNFLGNARRLSVGGKYSSLIGGVDLRLTQPWFFDWPVTLDARLSVARETPRAYEANRISQTVELERKLVWGWRGRIGHGLEWADVTKQRANLPSDVKLPDTTRLSLLPFGLRHSTLDDRIDPTRGTWLDLAAEPSLGAIGSQVDYLKLSGELRAFAPLWHTVLGFRWRMATLEPVLGSSQRDVPVFKRLYAGGSTSVRGFGYQRLGPLDSDGNPIGGLSSAEGSVELRFPIWRWFSGVVFTDAGEVQIDPWDWRPGDLRYSSGIGLRVKTPIGPLRVDGARLYNPPGDIGRYGVYFSIGQAF